MNVNKMGDEGAKQTVNQICDGFKGVHRTIQIMLKRCLPL